MKKQKIDLIIVRPTDRKKAYGQLSNSVSAVEPPLWVALLGAYVRQRKFTVKAIDVEAENYGPKDLATVMQQYEPLLVVFAVIGSNLSASTWHMTGARNYIAALRNDRPKIKTLLWGLHPSALPERTLMEEGVDFVCQGEGFVTLVKLLGLMKKKKEPKLQNVPGLWYFENGKVRSNPMPPLIKDLDELPNLAWDLLPMEKYRAHNWHCFNDLNKRQPYGVIYASLGCPFSCDFCNLKALFGSPGIRFRTPKRVIDDIDMLVKKYNVTNIKVLDECFVLRESYVLEICDLLIERNYDLNIWAYARIDTVNEILLSNLKKAGFNWLCYGIESPENNVRNGVAKGHYSKDDILNVVNITKKAGINIVANFMFGLPDDNLQTMRNTLDFAKELNCEYTNFYTTKAYPGSALYKQALQQGIELPETWRGYSEYSEDCLPLSTKHLSGRDVLRFRDDAFVEFYTNPEYLEMINNKFSQETVDYIKCTLNHKIPRKYSASESIMI
ncbi:MAG: B12-binding domain-containing radical SAM protein [Planctomycetota bacterium]|jgi:radical SAM superfamily enzyme YgiQ (UPF0313 family)